MSDFDIGFLRHLLDSKLFSGNSGLWPATARQALQGLMHADLRMKSARRNGEQTLNMSTKPRNEQIDVLVICALAKEQMPAIAAFGLDPNSDEDDNVDGHKIFFSTLNIYKNRSIKLGIAAVNAQRNVKMGILTRDLIARYKPGDAFLCGITASRPDKSNFGDVFPSVRVWDVAGGRVEKDKRGRRDEAFSPSTRMQSYRDYFGPGPQDWRERVMAGIAEARQYPALSFVSDHELTAAGLNVTPGIYFVDETLMANGDWQELVDRDQRAIAREMESSGFAQACGEKVGWLVFKACSDFGDSNKNDAWQQTSAFISALAVRLFLETQYRVPSGPDGF
jgi:nucleoside phosphorylase